MTRHAIERARERYGLELTEKDIAALQRKVANGDAILQQTRGDVQTWYVKHGEKYLRVRTTQDGTIVTVLANIRRQYLKTTHQKPSRQHIHSRVRDRDENWRQEIW